MSAGELPDAWARVTDIFHRAATLAADERLAFVELQAEGDASLVAEVMSLLAAHDRAGTFIEQPAAEAVVLAEQHERSAAPELAAIEVEGQMVGHYRLIRVLGVGGMGIVHLAEDTRLGRTVALKALAPGLTREAAQRSRLAREARAAAALSHPGIATVFALEEVNDQLYIASEYVAGPTLREELAGGTHGARRAHATMLALARALSAAHGRGIVHRDLKPENVVRAADGTLKILDFGLARFLDDSHGGSSLTRDGAVLGTPAYMSPEQIRGDPVDARADIFALGVIAYEQATGAHPFDARHPAATLARVLEHHPPRFDDADIFARCFEDVVLASLVKSPDARMQTADDLIRALEACGANVDTSNGVRAGVIVTTTDPAPLTARWWWTFHQATAIVVHVLLMAPVWRARDLSTADRGMWLFLIGILVVSVGGALRMHLLFVARHYPGRWHEEHRRSIWWVRGADVVFAGVLLTAGVSAIRAEAPAALLVAAAASVAVASCVIDPATTRVAWARERNDS